LHRQDDIRGQLREEHDAYLAELDALGVEGDAPRSTSRLRALRHGWAIHSLAEESIVYRALEASEDASAPGNHSAERFIEHELIEELFEKLERGRPGTLEWQARLRVARDIIARHIANEQEDVFARLERQFGAEALRRMSADFSAERDRLAGLEEPKAA
jgi:hypothetical protein